MATRRDFLKAGTLGGSGLYLASRFGFIQRTFSQAVPGGSLDPFGVPRFITPLYIPPAMPPTNTPARSTTTKSPRDRSGSRFCPLACRRRASGPMDRSIIRGTFHSPAPTFEARCGRVARVKWINDLVDSTGRFRRHLLPIDQTLHWANPPGPRDGMGMDPEPVHRVRCRSSRICTADTLSTTATDTRKRGICPWLATSRAATPPRARGTGSSERRLPRGSAHSGRRGRRPSTTRMIRPRPRSGPTITRLASPARICTRGSRRSTCSGAIKSTAR